jgi:hypothetical protein
VLAGQETKLAILKMGKQKHEVTTESAGSSRISFTAHIYL